MDNANCDGEFGELESFNEPLQTSNSNKSSLIWGYFENCKELDKAACNHCKQKVYKGIGIKATTSSMRKHLKFKHKTLFEKLLTSEELKKEAKAKDSIQTGKRQMSLYESVNKKICWDMNDAKSKEIHKIIGEMICVDNEPFNMVERSGFNKLMAFVKPQYKMPGRKYFTGIVIPEMYIELKTKIMSTLETVAAVSLTSDIWTCSHNNASFISFTSHWISEDFKQHHSTLNIRHFPGRHTGFAIKNSLEELLNEWNLMGKIHLLIRDNGANMKKGVDDASLDSFGCFLHTIHLLVTESMKSQKSVQDLLGRARKVSTHFHHSSSATDRLKSIQIGLGVQHKKVIQDICTRWNSSFYMLERLFNLKNAILIFSSEVPSSLPSFNANDWTVKESLLNLLRPFEELTKRISSNKSIISEVIPAIMSLNSFLNHPSSIHFEVGTTKDVMLSRLHKRFENVMKNKNLILATFLDPRFKLLFFKPEKIQEVKKIILSTISNFNNLDLTVVPDDVTIDISSTTNNNNQTSVKSLWDFYNEIATSAPSNNSTVMMSNNFTVLDDYTDFNKDLVAEYETYCNVESVPINGDPLGWWSSQKKNDKYPYIGNMQLLQKYLSAPASSVYSERLFSEAGLVYEAKRSQLHPEKAEQILFLHHNLNKF